MSNRNPINVKETKPWDSKEIKYLKNKYPDTPNRVMADKLGRSPGAVRAKAVSLSLTKNNHFWNDKDKKYLLDSVEVMSYEEIGEKIGRTKWAVINMYRELSNKRKRKNKLTKKISRKRKK